MTRTGWQKNEIKDFGRNDSMPRFLWRTLMPKILLPFILMVTQTTAYIISQDLLFLEPEDHFSNGSNLDLCTLYQNEALRFPVHQSEYD